MSKKLLLVSLLFGSFYMCAADKQPLSLWQRVFGVGNVDKEFFDAVLAGEKDVAIKALKLGANPNFRWFGVSATELVLKKRLSDVLELMIDRGLDFKNSPLLASVVSLNFPLQTIEKVIAAGGNPNNFEGFGASPLAYAKTKDVAQALLDAGAQVNVKFADGSTPLMRQVLSGSFEIVDLLLDQGADINAVNDSKFTALHFAAALKDPKIAQLLVSRGADVHAKSELGATPLMIAQAFHNKPLYDYLLSVAK